MIKVGPLVVFVVGAVVCCFIVVVDSCVDGTVDTFIVVIDELLFIVVGSVDLPCFEAVVIVIFVAIVDCFSVMDDNNIDEFVGMKFAVVGGLDPASIPVVWLVLVSSCVVAVLFVVVDAC